MSLAYAWEKTMVAVTRMATDPSSINDRIARAYVDSLIRIRPEHDLPEDLRPLFAEIHTVLTAKPTKDGEGTVAASARAMGRDEAADVARKIVQLYYEVCAALRHDEDRRRALQRPMW